MSIVTKVQRISKPDRPGRACEGGASVVITGVPASCHWVDGLLLVDGRLQRIQCAVVAAAAVAASSSKVLVLLQRVFVYFDDGLTNELISPIAYTFFVFSGCILAVANLFNGCHFEQIV
jgi:hypothetical protein